MKKVKHNYIQCESKENQLQIDNNENNDGNKIVFYPMKIALQKTIPTA